MKLTTVEKNFLSWTEMHIDFVMCKKWKEDSLETLKNSKKVKAKKGESQSAEKNEKLLLNTF